MPPEQCTYKCHDSTELQLALRASVNVFNVQNPILTEMHKHIRPIYVSVCPYYMDEKSGTVSLTSKITDILMF